MRQCHSKPSKIRFRILFCVLTTLYLTFVTANAQIPGTDSILGKVMDGTGALVPSAGVGLVDVATQHAKTVFSDSNGSYAFPNISIRTCSLTVAAPGFCTCTKTGIFLKVGSSIAIDVKLAIGTSDRKVEVNAENLALQTEDVSSGRPSITMPSPKCRLAAVRWQP